MKTDLRASEPIRSPYAQNINPVELKVIFLEIVYLHLYSDKVWRVSMFSFCTPPRRYLRTAALKCLIPVNFMKLPGDPWNNRWSSFYKFPNPPWKISTQKFPWNSMEIGVPIFSMEFHGKCLNPPCKYFPWKSMEFHVHGGFSHGLFTSVF